MWDVLFWLLIGFICLVACGTIRLGRTNQLGKTWSDVHVWSAGIIIMIAIIVRWGAGELGFANLLLVISAIAAHSRAREIWLDCFFSGKQSD